jgi:hypothetical protein
MMAKVGESNHVPKMSETELLFSLRKEGLTANAIHERLFEIFGLIAMPYSTMTKIIRETC